MQKRKIRWSVLVLCTCMLCTVPAWASGIQERIDDAGEKIDELEHALDKADQSISTYQQEERKLEEDISKGQDKISRLSAELDDTKEAIGTKKEEIIQTKEKLSQSQEDKKEQYANMKQRIRFMYENSLSSVLENLLEAGSLSEFLRRAEYFEAVVSYDREKLEEYKATVRKVKKEKEELLAEEEELETLEAKQTKKLDEIDEAVQGLKVKLYDTLSRIQDSKALRDAYAKKLKQQKEYEAELERQKAAEDKRRRDEIRRQEEELERQREQQQKEDNGSGGSGSSTDVWYDDAGDTSGASDLELLATIIYCEAGNQSYEGKLAVGSVIMNRVASSSFPGSISGVIYQSGQFSPVASGRFADALARGLGSSCKSVAQEVIDGKRNVTCLYFRTNNGEIDGIVIGDHVFY